MPDSTNWSGSFPWDNDITLTNQKVFLNEDFRENQREIINAVKMKKDVLAFIPTGGGKSLTFQLTAVTGQGVTIVIMPLVSLIEDNLSFVTQLGIKACSLSHANSSNAKSKGMGLMYRDISQLKYKIVYLTPEKLMNSVATENVLK